MQIWNPKKWPLPTNLFANIIITTIDKINIVLKLEVLSTRTTTNTTIKTKPPNSFKMQDARRSNVAITLTTRDQRSRKIAQHFPPQIQAAAIFSVNLVYFSRRQICALHRTVANRICLLRVEPNQSALSLWHSAVEYKRQRVELRLWYHRKTDCNPVVFRSMT